MGRAITAVDLTPALPMPDHARARSRVSLWLALSKARLVSLVVVTAAVGYAVATPSHGSWMTFALLLVGTSLAAGGANAINQCIEWRRDAQMRRTRTRPIPNGDLPLSEAWALAVFQALVGPAILLAGVNPLTAALAAGNILLYVLIYTPLKPITPLNTVVGAVCGAIPPMMGWAAATGDLAVGAWVLGTLLMIWQIPHFLALAWMYREDYADGGYRMLPAVDPQGQLTGRLSVLTAAALIPICVCATVAGLAGGLFLTGSLLISAWFLALAMQMQRNLTAASARAVFLASIVYLPVTLTLLVLDRGALVVRP